VNELIGGHIPLMISSMISTLPHVRSGKLKALGIGSEQRNAALPNVPTLGEALPGFVAMTWFGVVAPPKTPLEIAAKVSAGIVETLKLPDVARKLIELSAEPIGNTPAEMTAFMRQDAERWRTVIRAAGVKVD